MMIDNLLKQPAEKAYTILQEQEERTAEERRQRALEEKRAEAGGIIMTSNSPNMQPAPMSPENSVESLKKLKELLDAGLITQGEFEAKRQAIIARI